MVNKVVSGYPTHRKGHPSFYEGYYRNGHFPHLSMCNDFSGEQYGRPTSWGLWYLCLKTSIFAGESTRLSNLPI